MWTNPQKTVDLFTYTKEIFIGKFHFCAITRGVSPLYSCIQSKNRNMLTIKLSLLISILSSVIITKESDFEKITDWKLPEFL